jgi:trafficking protein particle complex subunit 11
MLFSFQKSHTILFRHYSQAYSHLLDVRIVDTNALEVKAVASFLNYKLCRIAFNLNLPRDAISQFRKHIEIFKPVTGPKDISFEHHAWLSKQ